MTVNSELIIEIKEPPEYPCIGKYPDNMLVLFTDKCTGTVIHQGHSGHKIGTYADYWINTWHKFNGKVTLTNGE
jgi:hypothetical protein